MLNHIIALLGIARVSQASRSLVLAAIPSTHWISPLLNEADIAAIQNRDRGRNRSGDIADALCYCGTMFSGPR
jgi:hypothetical protein